VATALDILIKATDQASSTLNTVSTAGKKVDTSLTGAGTAATKSGGFFSSAAGKLALFGGGAVLAKKAFDVVSTGMKDAQEADRVFAGLSSTLKSMGRSVPAQDLKDLADGLEASTGFTSESIQEGQRLFSTFGNISDKLLQDLTPSIVDFAAQFSNGNIEGAATMMGKALDDPIKGLTAMSKVGVSFSAKQKEMITTMVEAGDIAGAQGVIMEALGPQIDGAGKASQTAGKKFSNSFGNLGESIARLLVPALNVVVGLLTTVFDALASGNPVALAVVAGIGLIVAAFAALKIQAGLAAVQAGLLAIKEGAMAIASGVASAAQWALNAAMTANPIGLIVAAIAAVVAGIVLFATKTEIGRKIFSTAFNAIKDVATTVFNFLKTIVTTYFNIYKGIFEAVKTVAVTVWHAIRDTAKAIWDAVSDAVRNMWDKVKGIFQTMKEVALNVWDRIKEVGSTIWGAITGAAQNMWNAVRTILNTIISGINRVHDAMAFANPFGGAGWDRVTPLARGGIITGPTLAMVGEAGPEAVIPLNRRGLTGLGGGGGTTIHVHGSVIAERDLKDLVKKAANIAAARNAGKTGF